MEKDVYDTAHTHSRHTAHPWAVILGLGVGYICLYTTTLHVVGMAFELFDVGDLHGPSIVW